MDNVLVSPWILMVLSIQLCFYIFSYAFDFFKHLLKNNNCPFVLHELSLVCKFVDDLFVLNFSNFESFMYLDQDLFNKIACSQKHLVG
jgi:hypothetical protein